MNVNTQNNVNVTAQDLETMGNNLEKGKTLLGKSEGKLESLYQQKKQLHEEISQLGVEPEKLSDEIEKIDKMLLEKVEEFKKLIPIEFIEKIDNNNQL